jgi:outer membrane protein assembly factor BamB
LFFDHSVFISHLVLIFVFFFQGFLYIGTNNGIVKLHPFSGTQVGFFWTPSSVSRTFSVFDDRIVFGTDDGQIYSVGLDMTLMWNVSIGAQFLLQSSVLTDGIRLFFISDDDILRAVDASTG